MRILVLLIALVMLPVTATGAYAKESVNIALPPASIAQWYKPQNKRQVWLHLMFRLGQTSQAISSYEEAGDTATLSRWVAEFGKSYQRIPEMVPEWSSEIDQAALKNLQSAAATNDGDGIKRAMGKIRQT